jgi:hypothetical protein
MEEETKNALKEAVAEYGRVLRKEGAHAAEAIIEKYENKFPDFGKWCYALAIMLREGRFKNMEWDLMYDRFKELAVQWKKERAHSSRVKDMIDHPAYREIMLMGRPAITFILMDLQDNGPEHWFNALHVLSGETTNVVPDSERGVMPKMTERWLEWGRKNGYIK